MRYTNAIRPIAAVLATILTVNSIALAASPDPVNIHNKILERGIGKGVKIKEADGTIVTGNLTAIHGDSFEVVPLNATQPVTIAYTQVSAVHNSGHLSTGAKVGIVVGCVVAAIVVALVIVLKHADIGGLGKGPII
jgi:hypothetical protein